MKKMIVLLAAMILWIGCCAAAEQAPGTIQSMTGLGELREKLDQGAVFVKVYYTDGYGFSTSEFTTEDPEEMEQLWNAVNAITVGERVDESITDWYPQIVFYLSDGTHGSVCFEGKWLNVGTENYEIGNADDFRSLTASLVEKYEEMEAHAVPGGTAAATLEPLPVDLEKLDLSNGTFDVQIEDPGDVEENRCLLLSLYLPERYDPDRVRALVPGDTVLVSGKVYTVRGVNIRDVRLSDEDPESPVYEIDTEEENPDGIRFLRQQDGSFIAGVGDWTPVHFVGNVVVPLPLPSSFVYCDYPGGEDPVTGSEKELLADLAEDTPELFSPYNTNAVFRNGELLELHSWSYPWGPDGLPDD